MTLGTMRSALQTKLRIGAAGDALLTTTVLNTCINEALDSFSRARQWPWLLTSASVTISTSGTGALPADFGQARQFLMPDSTGAKNAVPYVSMDDILNSENRYVWSEDGTNIRVEPAPSASLSATLWYYRTETSLAADGNNPICPAAHQSPIILWAAHLASIVRRDFDTATAFEREYDREMAALAKYVFRKAGGGVRVERRAERTTISARWA